MDNCRRDTFGLPTRQPPGSAVREAAQEPCSPRSGTTPSRAGITSYQAVALERARTQLTRCLDRASRSQWIETSECRWLRSSFAEKTFRILFVGQSRQRTAAVINALLGQRVLPSPLYARDATVSVVRYGPNPAARLEPPENRVFAVSSESQREAVVQSATRTRCVIIERPSPWLAGGLELLHTPPVGSLWEYNRHVAHRYLASVDAIVFVSSTQRPLSRLESEFLSDLVPYGEKAFFVLDEPAPPRPGQDRSTGARAKRIRLAIDPRIPIFAVSAGRSLAGKLDCKIGLPPDLTFAAFEHELRHFLDTRRRDTWLQPFARSLSRILSHARARLNLERSALTASDDEMARWSAALDLGKERLHDALRTAEEWLCEGAGAILRSEVDAAVESFANRERRRIRAATAGRAASEEKLRSTVRAAYARWLLREERTVSRAFDSLCARFWSEVQSAIDAFMCDAGELYALRQEDPGTADVDESVFRYRFWPHPATVRLRWMLCDPSFPRVVGGARQKSHLGESALDQIQVHARRIRRDFEWRTGQSVEDICAHAKERVVTTAAGVMAALECAAELRRKAPEQCAARGAQLADGSAALLRLQARVHAISASPVDAPVRRIASQTAPQTPARH